MLIQRGVRDKLSNHINAGKPFDVVMEVSGNAEYDFCCFGVDGSGKLSDDRYMVFYNQTSSPSHEIEYSLAGGKAKFTVNLHSHAPAHLRINRSGHNIVERRKRRDAVPVQNREILSVRIAVAHEEVEYDAV